MTNKYKLVRLSESQAAQILDWRYQPPYDFYNPPEHRDEDSAIKKFLNPDLNFHAVLNMLGEFIGFCSFGIDGQVPGGDYSERALDVGLGMKPEFTGKGMGFEFFNAILEYVREQSNPSCVRLTVADFNQRALRLYQKFGFVTKDRFIDKYKCMPYTILMLDLELCTD